MSSQQTKKNSKEREMEMHNHGEIVATMVIIGIIAGLFIVGLIIS